MTSSLLFIGHLEIFENYIERHFIIFCMNRGEKYQKNRVRYSLQTRKIIKRNFQEYTILLLLVLLLF